MSTTQTAIVTGASSGVGLGLTRVLLGKGYRVVANARRVSSAGTLKPSSNLVLVDGDVADLATGASLTRTAVERFGSASGNQLGPAICPDGAGGAIVIWHDRRRFPFNIEGQHVLASSQVDAAWPTDGRALLTDSLAQSIVPQGKR